MKRNLFNVAMFGLLAVAVPASTFVSCKDYDEDFAEIKATMKSDKEALQAADAAINAKITAIETQLVSVESKLAALKTQQDLNISEIKKCAEDIAKLKAAVATLQEADVQIKKLIADLENNKVDKTTYAADLEKLNAAIKAAQTAADAAGKAAKAADDKAVAAQKTADEALKKAEQGIKDAAAAAAAAKVADGKATKAQQDLDAYKIATNATLEAQAKTIAEYKKQLDALAAADKKLETALAAEKARIDQLVTDLAKVKAIADAAATKEELEQTVEQIGATIEELAENFNTRLSVLEVLGGLKSMSLVPVHYYAGLDAIESPMYKFDYIRPSGPVTTVNYAHATVDNVLEYPLVQTGQPGTVPAVWATYALNPSNAKVEANKDLFSFTALDATLTRAGFVAPKVKNVKVENGMVMVELDLSHRATSNTGTMITARREQISTIALNYMKEENGTVTKVTSDDYAVFYDSYYTDAKLIMVGKGDMGTTYATREAAQQQSVKYDAKIDLKPLIASQRDFEGEWIAWDENDAQENNPVETAGFSYHYALVQETPTDKNYEYFSLKDGVLTPQGAKGESNSLSAVGQTAKVRVTLQKGDKVVAAGYFDVVVTAETFESAAIPAFTDVYTMKCADNDLVLNAKQVDYTAAYNEVKKKTNYTDAQMTSGATGFNFVTSGTKLKTYTKQNNNTWTEDAVAKADITVNPTTKKFTINVTQKNAAEQIQTAGNSFKTYVQYKNSNNVTCYMLITWTPSAVNNSPSYDYAATHKTIANQYEHDGRKEFRINVGQDDKTIFNYNLTDGFVGNKVAIKFADNSPYAANLNATIVDRFVFDKNVYKAQVKGVTGNTYNISVTDDGKTLLAANINTPGTYVAVATIASDIITYANTGPALDILNVYGRHQMGDNETFTARIKRTAKFCADKELTVTNNAYIVRFIRPINIVASTVEVFDDAMTPVQEKAANIEFTDWRNYSFNNYPGLYENDTEGYAIDAIEAADKSEWTTTLNGGSLGNTLLTKVTNNLKLEWVAPTNTTTDPISKTNSGKVRYTANNAVTTKFQVRIPLTVTYRWGKIKTYIDVTINPTVKAAP